MTDYAEIIDKVVESLKTDLTELTLKIHDNPELGRQEVKACRWQTELLEKYGFETETPFAGFETAYKQYIEERKTARILRCLLNMMHCRSLDTDADII